MRAIKIAYADPPYIGQARRHYDCEEIDHVKLIRRLYTEFPDGWALSCSTPSLRTILNICHGIHCEIDKWQHLDVRVAAWVKSFGAFKKGVRPAYMWEPVIFRGGRNPSNGFSHAPPERNGKQNTPKDFFISEIESPAIKEPITLKKGLVGAKPEAVCRWILELLNVQPGDEVIDLFPGTGIMGEVAALVTTPNSEASAASAGAATGGSSER